MSAPWRVFAVYLLCVSTASAGMFNILSKSDVTCDMKEADKFGLVVLSGSIPESRTIHGAPLFVDYSFSSPNYPMMGLTIQVQKSNFIKNHASDFPGNGFAQLLILRVKAGDYSLDSWGYKDANLRYNTPMDTLKKIPFQVAPGRVTYLGSFEPQIRYGENMLGTDVARIWPISVDNSQRDLSQLFKTCPELDIMQVDMSPLDLRPWMKSNKR